MIGEDFPAGPGTARDGPQPPAACSVASSADVTAALGEAFTRKEGTRKEICAYEASDGKSVVIVSAIIDKPTWESSEKYAVQSQGAHPVASLGDGAYFKASQTEGKSIAQLVAYKGMNFVTLTVDGPQLDLGKLEAGETSLMRTIFAKL